MFLSALGVALAYLVPLVSHQVSQLGKTIPDLITRAQIGIVKAANKLGLHVNTRDVFASIDQKGLSALR